MTNLFDFSDVSDLSENLQKRLSGGGRVNPNIVIYSDIVKAGNAAGVGALSISMIEGVASRMGLPALKQQSIRNALTSAIAAGLIMKVTRQTYGVIGTEMPVVASTDDTAEVATEVAPPLDVTDSDPLANPLA